MNTDITGIVFLSIAIGFLTGISLHKWITDQNNPPKAKAGDRIKITGGVEYEGLPLKCNTYYICKVVKYKDAPAEYIIRFESGQVILQRNQFVIYKK